MDRPATPAEIDRFVADYRIDVTVLDRHPHEFTTVNELFSRPLPAGARPIADPDDPTVAVSPTDCRLTCSRRRDGASDCSVKGRRRHRGPARRDGPRRRSRPVRRSCPGFHDAARIDGFSAAVCRLAPGDYHRFHWPVDGEWRSDDVLDLAGEYHSVAAGVRRRTGRRARPQPRVRS